MCHVIDCVVERIPTLTIGQLFPYIERSAQPPCEPTLIGRPEDP